MVPIGETDSSGVGSKCLMREMGSRPCHLEVICKCWLREKKVFTRQRADTSRECSRLRSSAQALRERLHVHSGRRGTEWENREVGLGGKWYHVRKDPFLVVIDASSLPLPETQLGQDSDSRLL